MTEPLIRARGLTKTYGDFIAVDGIDFDVAKGESFGLLGPNGAGKTTLLSILTTLLKPSSGTAEICGLDIIKNPSEVYGIAAVFERKVLIDYALQSYEIALEIDSNMNFNFQMAVLYGQKGETDKMIEKFLEESYKNPQNLILIQNTFITF